MICDLAQAGIGGNTMLAVKQNLTLDELAKWDAYREKNGGFNLGLRIERAAAMLAAMWANAHSKKGKKFKIKDFMPYGHEPEIFGVNDGWDD